MSPSWSGIEGRGRGIARRGRCRSGDGTGRAGVLIMEGQGWECSQRAALTSSGSRATLLHSWSTAGGRCVVVAASLSFSCGAWWHAGAGGLRWSQQQQLACPGLRRRCPACHGSEAEEGEREGRKREKRDLVGV